MLLSRWASSAPERRSLADALPGDRTDRDLAGRIALDHVPTGHWDLAARMLASAGVTRPAPQPGPADLALAATHAAAGNDDAHRWLAAVAADVPWVQAVLATVAEVRGEQAHADALWQAAHDSGTVTMPWNRLVTAMLVGRNRHDLDSAGVAVYQAAMTTARIGGPVEAVEAARNLEARGDQAGARLLLRGYATLVRRDPQVRAEAARLRPRWHFLPMLGGTLVATGIIAFGQVQHAHGRPLPFLAVVPFLAVALLPRIPTPGLTLPESHLRRSFRHTTWDPDTGLAVRGQHGGWYGVAGIGGAVGGLVLGLAALPAVLTGLGQDLAAWEAYSFVATLVLAVLGAVVAVLVLRRAFARTEQRRIREQLRQSRQQSSTCACASLRWLRGTSADDYLRDHLLAPRDGPAAPLPGCEVATCPQVGVLWLSGPIGTAGAHLLLRGAAPELEEPTSTDSSGFYLWVTRSDRPDIPVPGDWVVEQSEKRRAGLRGWSRGVP